MATECQAALGIGMGGNNVFDCSNQTPCRGRRLAFSTQGHNFLFIAERQTTNVAAQTFVAD